jgi:cellulose synthase (UDP-forming)
MIHIARERRRAYLRTCRILSVVSAVFAIVYVKWLFVDARPDNHILFAFLVAAESFNIIQAVGFWYTISIQKWTEPAEMRFSATAETVDIFITVCGEPREIVERTIRGAMAVRHPRKNVWVLDDGRDHEMEVLAYVNGAGYLTRPMNRGAKAGNINDAMKRTHGDYIVIFDADHVPRPDFLEKTLGAFTGPKIAFVQTPQSYANRVNNRVAWGAHDQQRLFYGPIMRGKLSVNAAFSCGTNVIFRRSALQSIGGMPEDSITEDLRVTLMLFEKGYTSEYVPIVLAHGMGPLDVSGFFSQQLRWARGGLEILFRRKPFYKGMSAGAGIQFALSFWYWFTGFAYAVYLMLPVAFLLFGQRPVQAPNEYPIYFLPYVIATLVTMTYAADFDLTFRGVWFTLASFPVHFAALVSALFGRDAKFIVTSKSASSHSLRPVAVHITAIVVLAFSIVFGLWRWGFNPSVMNNVAFAAGHILLLQGFVRYARRPEVPVGEEGGGGTAESLAFEEPAVVLSAAETGITSAQWGGVDE